jgi:hypothetical protein
MNILDGIEPNWTVLNGIRNKKVTFSDLF